MKTVEVCAAIIVNENNEIFTCQRGYGEFKDGWEFPGGKIEPGETKEQCIIREIKEELCVTINPISFIGTVEYDYSTFHLIMHCFISKVISGSLDLKEHEDKKYLDLNHLDKVNFLPADLLVLPLIKNYFESHSSEETK